MNFQKNFLHFLFISQNNKTTSFFFKLFVSKEKSKLFFFEAFDFIEKFVLKYLKKKEKMNSFFSFLKIELTFFKERKNYNCSKFLYSNFFILLLTL
jgi:hypothetical protein